MYVSAYEVVSESLQTYTITLHWFLSENGSKSSNRYPMMLDNSWKLWLYYMNFQKPLNMLEPVFVQKPSLFCYSKLRQNYYAFWRSTSLRALWQFEFFLLFGTCRKSFSRHLFCPFGLGKKKASQDLLNHRP